MENDNLISGSNYGIYDYGIVGENAKFRLSGVNPQLEITASVPNPSSSFGFISYSGGMGSTHFISPFDLGGGDYAFVATPELNPPPAGNYTETATFLERATVGQVRAQETTASYYNNSGTGTSKNTNFLNVHVTASVDKYDFLSYGGETRMVYHSDDNNVQNSYSFQIFVNDSFASAPVMETVGGDVVVTPGTSPVSGSTYKIIQYTLGNSPYIPWYTLLLENVNPTALSVSGALVEYNNTKYWINSGQGEYAFLWINGQQINYSELRIQQGFATSPVVGTDTVTYIGEPTANEIVQIVPDPLGTSLNNIFVVGNYDNTNYAGHEIIYSGETRYVVDMTRDISTNVLTIVINSPFSSSPANKILGSDVTYGPAAAPGEVIFYSSGSILDPTVFIYATTGSYTVNIGDQMTYLGETRNVTDAYNTGNTYFIAIDTAFSNNIAGEIMGVDIIITPAPQSGKQLIPSERTVPRDDLVPDIRTVPENDLTPDVRDVPRADLVPDVINKGGLIPS